MSKSIKSLSMNTPAFKEAEFPNTLYVHAALEGSTNSFDAYANLVGVEQGDTVAVYQLVSVKRVRVKTLVELEEIGV